MSGQERLRAQAYELLREGVSIAQVAARLGVSCELVAAWLRAVAVNLRVRRCKLCGTPFATRHGQQRYCTRAHAEKWARLRRGPAQTELYRDQVRALEAELAELLDQLDTTTTAEGAGMTADTVLRARVLALSASRDSRPTQIAGRLGVAIEQVRAWQRRPLTFALRPCRGCGELVRAQQHGAGLLLPASPPPARPAA